MNNCWWFKKEEGGRGTRLFFIPFWWSFSFLWSNKLYLFLHNLIIHSIYYSLYVFNALHKFLMSARCSFLLLLSGLCNFFSSSCSLCSRLIYYTLLKIAHKAFYVKFLFFWFVLLQNLCKHFNFEITKTCCVFVTFLRDRHLLQRI